MLTSNSHQCSWYGILNQTCPASPRVVAIGALTCTQTPLRFLYTVAPSQKTKSIQWADPVLDMANLRSYVERDVAVVIGGTRTKSVDDD